MDSKTQQTGLGGAIQRGVGKAPGKGLSRGRSDGLAKGKRRSTPGGIDWSKGTTIPRRHVPAAERLPHVDPVAPPPPGPSDLPPRAAWNPNRREFGADGRTILPPGLRKAFSDDPNFLKTLSRSRYLGHWSPSQFMPNYGDSIGAEAAKAKNYYDGSLKGRPGDPGLDHSRIFSRFPVMEGESSGIYLSESPRVTSGGGIEAGLSGSVLIGDAAKSREAQAADGLQQAMLANKYSPAEADRIAAPGGVERERPSIAQHEMRHAWTMPSKGEGIFDTPDSLSRRGIPSIGQSADLASSVARSAGPTVLHGLSPEEQLGWMSGIQHELFGQSGRRLETPEEARSYLDRMLSLPDDKFEEEVGSWGSDSARGLRWLRSIPEENADFREQYVDWLSRVAPALVDSGRQDGTARKTAFLRRGLGKGLSSLLGRGARSMAGVPAGQPMFANRSHYLTRPAKILFAANLPKPLATARAAGLGAGAYGVGKEIYDATGEAAFQARSLADLARARGASEDQVAHLRSYGTRRGVVAGALRGNRATSWMVGGQASSPMARLQDQVVAGLAGDSLRDRMARKARSAPGVSQVLNPGMAVATRMAEAGAGRRFSPEALRSRLEALLGSPEFARFKDEARARGRDIVHRIGNRVGGPV